MKAKNKKTSLINQLCIHFKKNEIKSTKKFIKMGGNDDVQQQLMKNEINTSWKSLDGN